MNAASIARWNGSAWSAVGAGVNNHVDALAVFDDGSGVKLYAGGKFTWAGGVTASHIARWDGAAWSAVTGGGIDGEVEALAVMDDGLGPALYAGGAFANAGGVSAANVARYRGGRWSALGAGVDGEVRGLAAIDPDGPGGWPSRLAVGGDFATAGGIVSPRAAVWDGSAWNGMNGGVDGRVYAIAAFGGSVYAGGAFGNAGAASSPFIGAWAPCVGCYANCDGSAASPVLNVNDFVCFLNRFASGEGYANCDGSTTPPVLNALDFVCYLDRFAAGCP
jgi:hypothetical protein